MPLYHQLLRFPLLQWWPIVGTTGISLIKSELNAHGANIWSNLRMYLPFLVNIVPLHLLTELLPTICGSDIKLMCQTHVSNWVFHGRLLHLCPSCNATLEWRYNIRVLGWLLKSLNLITASGSFSDEPGSVTLLATRQPKIHALSYRNGIEKLTTFWPLNGSILAAVWQLSNSWPK